jgi:hypothetical protein
MQRELHARACRARCIYRNRFPLHRPLSPPLGGCFIVLMLLMLLMLLLLLTMLTSLGS